MKDTTSEMGEWQRERDLKSVGEDDVRIHGSNVEMVDHRILQSHRSRGQPSQLGLDLPTLFLKVCYLHTQTFSLSPPISPSPHG